MKVERLHLRFFLEGVELPIVSITVTMQRDSPATAAIQIVPTPIAFLIQPRTLVHVFFLDDTRVDMTTGVYGSSEMEAVNTGYEVPEVEDAEVVVPDVPAEYTKYRLLFVGEVMGFSYVKGESNRAVVLQCQDLSNYWDSVTHDRSGGLFAPTRMPAFRGEATGAFWDLLGGETGALYDKLTKPPSAFPHLVTRDPRTGQVNTSYMAGIMHLMEEVFGTYHRRRGGAEIISSPNPFAAMAELRLRLLQQVGVPPGDSTPLRLMASQGFGSLWRTSIRGLPRQFNFRTLMQALMQYTFYAVYPLSTPSYSPPTGDYAKEMGWAPEDADEVNSGPAIDSLLRRQIRALKTRAQRQLTAFSELPAGGVSASAAAALLAWHRTNEAYFNSTKTILNRLVPQVEGSNVRSRPQIKDLFFFIVRVCNDAMQYRVAPRSHTDHKQSLEKLIGYYDQILALLGVPPRRVERDVGEPAFLYTQLFRPDVWFCPPPRCNVLFPDQVSEVSFSRNFFAEPTRLMIKGYSAFLGSVPFFDNWYFTPMAAGLLRDRPVIRRSGGSFATGDASVSSDLMAHEIYTGIIPFFQSMSDREMTIGKNVLNAGRTQDEVDGQTMDYFQRVTNYLFFKARFSARTASVSCRFNPYLVPGYPGVVLSAPPSYIETINNEQLLQYGERTLDQLTAESTGEPPPFKGEILDLLKGRTGVHFLGVIEAVSHSCDASGRASTSVTFSYARDHRESVEFFGQDVQEARRRRRLYRYVRKQVQTWDPLGGAIEGATTGYEAGSGADVPTRGMAGPVPFNADTPEGQNPRDDMRGVITGAGGAFAGAFAGLFTGRRMVERTVRGEAITEKVWQVAAFIDNPPVPGALGPWGGEIKEVRDITDQVAPESYPDPASQRQAEQIDAQHTEIQRQLAALPDPEWSSGSVVSSAGVSVVSARLALEDRLEALDRQRAQLRARRATRPRLLSLFGVYPDGRRLPSASIRSDLIGIPRPAREFGPDVVSYVGSPNLQVTMHAYEFVEDIADGASVVDFPVEDIVRPPWYPAIWLNGRIGGGVYLPLLGVGAITDPISVMSEGAMPDTTALQQGLPALSHVNAGEEDEAASDVVGSIMHGATVEGAVDFLAHTYAKIRSDGYSTALFCGQYTWRPIATLFDLFGSADLELRGDGTVVRGVMGFHSLAYGPYADLFGLAPSETAKLLGIDSDDVAARARLDVRGRRRTVIQAYQQELLSYRLRGE